jgi:hypothetical protein
VAALVATVMFVCVAARCCLYKEKNSKVRACLWLLTLSLPPRIQRDRVDRSSYQTLPTYIFFDYQSHCLHHHGIKYRRDSGRYRRLSHRDDGGRDSASEGFRWRSSEGLEGGLAESYQIRDGAKGYRASVGSNQVGFIAFHVSLTLFYPLSDAGSINLDPPVPA